MAKHKTTKRGTRGKGRKTYSAFNYKEGGKVAFVNHFNILKASDAKRVKVAKGLLQRGIKTIFADGQNRSVKGFLKVSNLC